MRGGGRAAFCCLAWRVVAPVRTRHPLAEGEEVVPVQALREVMTTQLANSRHQVSAPGLGITPGSPDRARACIRAFQAQSPDP